MPFDFGSVGAIAGGIGGLVKLGLGIHQDHLANEINPVWQQYKTSPYAQAQLGIAQQSYNGRMAGAGYQQSNIANSQGNYLNNVNRNATDSSQALALAGVSQGQANNAYQNLGAEEAQNKNAMLQNLNQAYGAMTDEQWKEYQSMLTKYQMDSGTQNALRSGAWNDISGAANDIGSTAVAYGQYQKSMNK